MSDNIGKLWFVYGADVTPLEQSKRKAINIFQQIGNHAETEGARIDNMWKTLARRATQGLGAFGFAQFAKELVNVRSEFQNTEAAMKVFLGSGEKAKAFVKDIQKYAFNNVFEFKDLTQSAGQLLAFQHDVEDIIPIIDKLSNVASGVNVPLAHFIDLYNKAKSKDKLNLIDIQQWSVMGDVIADLSRVLGKSTDEIRDMISSGKVGFSEINMVLNDVTTSGGRFAGIMEEKMKTLGDSVGLLKDSITSMFNELGTKSEDFLRSGILAGNWMAENYESIGKVLIGLISTYGAYRAAVVVVNIVLQEQAAINAMIAASNGVFNKSLAYQFLWTERLQKAHALLNKTLLTNPYVLATTLVVGFAASMWALHDSTTVAEKAQQRLNDVFDEAKQKKENLISTGKSLINTIKDETATTYEQIKALKKLKEELPEVFAAMTLQDVKNLPVAEITTKISIAADDRELLDAEKSVTDLQAKLDKINRQLQDLYDNPNPNSGSGSAIMLLRGQAEKLNIDLTAAKAHLAEINDTRKQAEFDSKPAAERIAYYEQEKAALVKQRDELNKILLTTKEINDSWAGFNSQTSLNEQDLQRLNGLIDGTQAKIDAIVGKDTAPAVQNKSYWEQRKKDAEDSRDALDIAKKGSAEWNEYTRIITESDGKLKAYSIPDKKGGKSILDAQESLSKAILANDLALQESRIDILKDGRTKALAEIDLELQQKLAKIDEDKKALEKDRKEAGKGPLTAADLAGFDERAKNASTAAENTRGETIQKYGDELSEMYRQLGDVFLTEEERKQAGIEKTYDEMQKWAKKWYEGGGFGEVGEGKEGEKKYHAFLGEVDRSKTRATLSEALEEFKNYEQKRVDLAKTYNDKIAKLQIENVDGQYDKEIEEGQRKRDLALFEMQLSQADFYQVLFGDLERYSIASIQSSIEEARALVDAYKAKGNLTPEELTAVAKIEESITRAEEATRQRLPDGLKKTAQGLQEVADLAALFSHSLGDAVTTLATIVGSFGDMAQGSADFRKTLSDIKTMKDADNFKGFKFEDIVGFAGSFTGAIGSVIGGITSIFSMGSEAAKRHREAIQAVMDAKIAQQREYNLLLMEQNLLYEKGTTIFGADAYGKAANAVDVYKDALASLRKELTETDKEAKKSSFASLFQSLGSKTNSSLKSAYAGLASIDIVTGHKKTGLFGWGKGKDTYSSVLDVYPQLIKQNGDFDKSLAQTILSTHKMSDSAKNALQNLVDLADQYESAFAEVKGYLTDIFGELGNVMSDALIDAFQNGTDAAEAFTTSVGDMLKKLASQMIYSVTLAPIMEKAQEEMLSVMKNSSLTDTQKFSNYTTILSNLTNDALAQQGLVNNLLGEYQAIAKQGGLDLFKSETSAQTASARGHTATSQDSIDEVNGRITDIQGSARDLKDTAFKIHEGIGDLRGLALISITHLSGIEKNTKELYAIRDGIDRMSKQIEDKL